MKAIFRWRKAEAELEFLMQKIQKKKNGDVKLLKK